MVHAALDAIHFVEEREEGLPAVVTINMSLQKSSRTQYGRDRAPGEEPIVVALDTERRALGDAQRSEPLLCVPSGRFGLELDVELVCHHRRHVPVTGYTREREQAREIDGPVEAFAALFFVGQAGLLAECGCEVGERALIRKYRHC